MKYATARPYSDPEKAARRILEIANAVEPVQGRIHIEKVNESFLFRDGGSPHGIWRRHETRHRAWLAGDARVRNLRDLHIGRRRAVRLGHTTSERPPLLLTQSDLRPSLRNCDTAPMLVGRSE
jgi:hypothetical protein